MGHEGYTPQLCRHCGLEVENRGTPSMDGNHHVSWVHTDWGGQLCHPQRSGSPRATPGAARPSYDETQTDELYWRTWACGQCPDPCDSAKPWQCVRTAETPSGAA